MPVENEKSTFMECCGQTICSGCIHWNFREKFLNGIRDEVKASQCVFCRTPSTDKEEYQKRKKERIEANDPGVLRFVGSECHQARDYDKALKYLTKAAELGDTEAHSRLGCIYSNGEGVEKDEDKGVYHFEKAAIGGHPQARHNLSIIEAKNGNIERALKHSIIAANLGHDKSMKGLLPIYKEGYVTKEEYGDTLRAHQAAINATKSSQREAAEEVRKTPIRRLI
jgi:tetratricopeptide (TPR) repeat protein